MIPLSFVVNVNLKVNTRRCHYVPGSLLVYKFVRTTLDIKSSVETELTVTRLVILYVID